MKLAIMIVLFSTSLLASSSCGLEGSVEERIKSCNEMKGNFVLVSRTENKLEVYRDVKSGLVWGNRISFDFNQYGSQKACSEEAPENKFLKLKWRLPTIKEFEQAASHGMKAVLPNMNHSFWTSTPATGYKKKRRGPKAEAPAVFLWDGIEETTSAGNIMDGASVRCVARE